MRFGQRYSMICRMSRRRSNPLPAANSRRPFCFRQLEDFRCLPASSELGFPAAVAEGGRCDVKFHSVLLGWNDPDQALRVAAGTPRKHAPDGRRQGVNP
jgi:hypothetical protein